MSFDEIKKAWKRAKHFSASVEYFGPFTVNRNHPEARVDKSAMILASNWSLFLDACGSEPTIDLSILHEWARGINHRCDSMLISEDPTAPIAFASFLSRFFFDPLAL